MKFRIVIALMLIAVFTVGCSIKVSSRYAPSIMLEGTGEVKVTKFNYMPEGYTFDEKTGKHTYRDDDLEITIASNQIMTDGVTPEYLDVSVEDFITNALKKELKFIGYRVREKSKTVITGDIIILEHSYVGLTNSTYTSKIRFKIIDNVENKVVFEKTFKAVEKKNKFTDFNVDQGIHTAVSKSLEQFIRSAQGQGYL